MDITEYLTDCVNNNIPVSFSKYGDGEYSAMFQPYGCNCDRDPFTYKLSTSLKESFKYIVENDVNAYIGLWHDHSNKIVLEQFVNKPVKWAKYHTLILDKVNDDKKAILYKTIKESKLKKIIICNRLLIKSKLLLNIDECIFVPFNNWFDESFYNVLQKTKDAIGTEDGNHIVITCAGMSSKVLICELIKSFPNGIYLDFGSAMDLLCTKRDSRGDNNFSEDNYKYLKDLLKDCLPENWEHEMYNDIYMEAKHQLGLHLPN